MSFVKYKPKQLLNLTAHPLKTSLDNLLQLLLTIFITILLGFVQEVLDHLVDLVSDVLETVERGEP